jgi:hypothetical protein
LYSNGSVAIFAHYYIQVYHLSDYSLLYELGDPAVHEVKLSYQSLLAVHAR